MPFFLMPPQPAKLIEKVCNLIILGNILVKLGTVVLFGSLLDAIHVNIVELFLIIRSSSEISSSVISLQSSKLRVKTSKLFISDRARLSYIIALGENFLHLPRFILKWLRVELCGARFLVREIKLSSDNFSFPSKSTMISDKSIDL